MSMDKLFYSLQGEGPTIGVPSVFFRVGGCTLDCIWCDTAEVWKNSSAMTFEEVYALLLPFLPALDDGAHLILTGGSPLRQQSALVLFLNYCQERHPKTHEWFIECETEGVLMPKDLSAWIKRWNVSPKLSNSGMSFDRRFKPDVLRHHAILGNSIFKFPFDVDAGADVQNQLDEIGAIRAMCQIGPRYTWLMPVCNDQASHRKALPKLAEIAKGAGYCLSPRLHLEIWDKATGV